MQRGTERMENRKLPFVHNETRGSEREGVSFAKKRLYTLTIRSG
jgi:hypothetical protein